MYLGWFDDAKDRTIEEKISEGIERYTQKFGHAPSLCMANPGQVVSHPAVRVTSRDYIQPNHFWLGMEHTASDTMAEAEPTVAGPWEQLLAMVAADGMSMVLWRLKAAIRVAEIIGADEPIP